jgi:5-methylthioadenosine/S-adenosylhomocysteine deaminase
MSRLLLRNTAVMSAPAFVPESAEILIEDGRIGATLPPGAAVDAEPCDMRGRLAIPGLVNAHTHSHANLLKGLADRWSLEMSLVNGPWVSGRRDAETMYWSTMVGAVDMLSRGCTACYDLVYEFPRPSQEGIEAVCRAYADAGMRAVVCPMVADRTLYDAVPGLAAAVEAAGHGLTAFALADTGSILATLEGIVQRWPWDQERLKPALAPTIPMHCSDELIMGCRDIALRHGAGIHMHIAEARFQAVAAHERYSRSMIRFLDDLGVIGPAFTAAHGVWLDDADFRILADRGASLVHMPLSNLRLGVGVADVRAARGAGLAVGLATDGANSADNLDLFEVMKLATLVSRTFTRGPGAWVSARDALEMATVGSARCLGWGDKLGAIRVGMPADLAFIDQAGSAWYPRNSHAVQLVNGAGQGAVTDVMVGGNFVIRNRHFVSIDIDRVLAQAQDAADRVFSETAELRKKAEAMTPTVVAHIARVNERYAGAARLIEHAHATGRR